MKAITQRESVVTYIKSCLIFQIPRFMLISKYRVISPLIFIYVFKHVCINLVHTKGADNMICHKSTFSNFIGKFFMQVHSYNNLIIFSKCFEIVLIFNVSLLFLVHQLCTNQVQ